MNQHNKRFDVTVIGGGLHGAAIAADCAGRGLRTILCDRGDVGGSHNTVSLRLFHCGLQYLQRGDLSRVSESLRERNTLLTRAPHLTNTANVVIPQRPGLRSTIKTNTQAFLYNLVAGQDSHLSARDIADTPEATPLRLTANPGEKFPAIQFEDAIVNDARLTIEHLILAKEKGALIMPHTAVTSARREKGCWQLSLQDNFASDSNWIESTCVVNATGPAANRVQTDILGIKSRCSASNYYAGYLVIPRLYEGNQCYLLECHGEHLVATLPYIEDSMLVGPCIFSQEENQANNQSLPEAAVQSLIDVVNAHFKQQITPAAVIHRFSILTSSYKETPDACLTPFSQDYVLDFNCSDGRSPAITLFGACINMHRLIAEQITEQMAPYLPAACDTNSHWTAEAILPGGRFTERNRENLAFQLMKDYSWAPNDLLERFARLYGQRSLELLANCDNLICLGKEILPGLYEREIEWLHDQEWALTPEAIYWHRTKLGYRYSNAQISQFTQWFKDKYHYQPPVASLHLHTQMNKEAS